MDQRSQLPDYCSLSHKWTLSSLPAMAKELKQHNASLRCCQVEKLEEEETSKGNLMDNPSAKSERGVSCCFMMCEKNVFSLRCTCSRGRVSVCHTALTDYSLSLKMRYLLASAVVPHCASDSYFLPF
ncbi:hypothetical protein E3U43_011733 [Larimichthys crocea]|uniref:Uncharacterized protein n=1 Tax=Larimichthys crocea TaxID=215358 RepID=A0ACD3QKL9_LARCR|nr:hypothetical protein E3U43_011733 [Larimichthys crocea]